MKLRPAPLPPPLRRHALPASASPRRHAPTIAAAAGALERARTRDKVSGLLGPVHQEHVASLQRSSGSAAPSSPALARATLERRRASDEPRRSLRARPARDDAGGVALHLGRPLSEYTAKYRFRLRQLEQNIRGF